MRLNSSLPVLLSVATTNDLKLHWLCCSFADQYHDGNHCFTNDGDFYSMGVTACTAAAIDPHVFQTWNNTLYSPSSAFSNGPCKDFAGWQAAGQDRGSKVLPMLAVADIVAMGKAIVKQ